MQCEVTGGVNDRMCRKERIERSCPVLVEIPCGVAVKNLRSVCWNVLYMPQDQLRCVVGKLGSYMRFPTLTSQQLLLIRPSSFRKGYMK
jgi:hypothetical protein